MFENNINMLKNVKELRKKHILIISNIFESWTKK